MLLDGRLGPTLDEPAGIFGVVDFADGNIGDVVVASPSFGVVYIVDAGGGDPTVVDDGAALDVGAFSGSEKTMSGAFGSLTTIAAWEKASAPRLTVSMADLRWHGFALASYRDY